MIRCINRDQIEMLTISSCRASKPIDSRRTTKLLMRISFIRWNVAVVLFFSLAMLDNNIAALMSLEKPMAALRSSAIISDCRHGDETPCTALLLAPSQVYPLRSRTSTRPSQQRSPLRTSTTLSISNRPKHQMIIPSQVLAAHPTHVESITTRNHNNQSTTVSRHSNATERCNEGFEPTMVSSKNKRSRQRRNRAKKRPIIASTNSTTTRHNIPVFSSGNLPDVHWQSIPMAHLRYHPNFQALPPPETISRLENLEDVRNFRQESWQWDALHAGRCTTSQAAATLGFLEPLAGDFLGVPRGLRRGGQGAFRRLSHQPALQTLEEMNLILCKKREGEDSSGDYTNIDTTASVPFGASNSRACTYWTTPSNIPFAAKYMVPVTVQARKLRRDRAQVYANTPNIQRSIRMIWGNIQEATALLTALNYFWNQDNRTTLKEVGMCGAGVSLNQPMGLLVGATPDALLMHPDGSVEAVEVKNHCPFHPNLTTSRSTNRSSNGKQNKKSKGKFRVTGQKFSPVDGVMPQYLPQLMMEMFCVGDNCQSAILVRQSALDGALIIRIHRDDQWIEEMMYWLRRFYGDFVRRNKPPPPNFFYQGDDQTRYKSFLESTKQVLKSKVELLAHIPNDEIQRASGSFPESNNLFLD